MAGMIMSRMMTCGFSSSASLSPSFPLSADKTLKPFCWKRRTISFRNESSSSTINALRGFCMFFCLKIVSLQHRAIPQNVMQLIKNFTERQPHESRRLFARFSLGKRNPCDETPYEGGLMSGEAREEISSVETQKQKKLTSSVSFSIYNLQSLNLQSLNLRRSEE